MHAGGVTDFAEGALRRSDGIMSPQVHHISMSKSTPTLTQSGLLAVLLEHQRCKAMRLARRRARLKANACCLPWATFLAA
jgi:hypothetical protein